MIGAGETLASACSATVVLVCTAAATDAVSVEVDGAGASVGSAGGAAIADAGAGAPSSLADRGTVSPLCGSLETGAKASAVDRARGAAGTSEPATSAVLVGSTATEPAPSIETGSVLATAA